MKFFGFLLMPVTFHSSLAFSSCYERIYSQKHLSKYKNQEIRTILAEEKSIYNESLGEAESHFFFQFTTIKNGKRKVGEISATCSPSWGWPRNCETKDSKKKFTMDAPNHQTEVLVKMPADTLMKDKTGGVESGKTLSFLYGDNDFIVNFIDYNCEEHLFKRNYLLDTKPRLWNEVALSSVRHDFARPTVTARNLFHLSAAMWDANAVFDTTLPSYYSRLEKINLPSGQKKQAQEEALSYAAYTLLSARYEKAPGNVNDRNGDGSPDMTIQNDLNDQMKRLGYDPSIKAIKGSDDSASVGIRIAKNILLNQKNDGSREEFDYAPEEGSYVLINPTPLDVSKPGIEKINDVNYWIPLFLLESIGQSEEELEWNVQPPLTLFWGELPTFSNFEDQKSPEKKGVFFDPGPALPKFEKDLEKFVTSNFEVVDYSAYLNPLKGPGTELIDVSPNTFGNNPLGTNDGKGYRLNPVTGKAYQKQMVKHADFGRTLAEFWADGPDSETPPGHWNTIANDVMDHPDFKYQWQGKENIDPSFYQLKLYLTLNGALHDSAVVAWGIKGHYQSNRPISVIRHLAKLAETDSSIASLIESKTKNAKMITLETTQTGGIHEHLKGSEGKLALYAWRGAPQYQGEEELCFYDPQEAPEYCEKFLAEHYPTPQSIKYAKVHIGGTDWILAENWMPYQRITFVTPPFPGFVSGHSTFSRAGAEVLTHVTGSKFFPGGLGKFKAPQLVFETGPEKDFELQWATYFDASDQSGLSRIYGGIHAYYDDLPGREIGSEIGKRANQTAENFFNKQ